jgi:hypothetical protein
VSHWHAGPFVSWPAALVGLPPGFSNLFGPFSFPPAQLVHFGFKLSQLIIILPPL